MNEKFKSMIFFLNTQYLIKQQSNSIIFICSNDNNICFCSRLNYLYVRRNSNYIRRNQTRYFKIYNNITNDTHNPLVMFHILNSYYFDLHQPLAQNISNVSYWTHNSSGWVHFTCDAFILQKSILSSNFFPFLLFR